MIWRWAICFSVTIVSCYAVTIKGQISVTDVKRGGAARPDRAGTVVWLMPLSGEPPEPKRESRLEMLQKNKSFQPHIMAIAVGSRVDFPNFDPIFHNAFSNYNGEVFDIGLYPPGSTRSVVFHREGVVRVFCNIHSSMSAIIVVLRSPYHTISGKDGSFRLDGVPAGRYQLHLYHERATEQTLAGLAKAVDVEGSSEDLGVITIPEDSYLPIPHLNKYGKPYGTANDPNTYPGARQ